MHIQLDGWVPNCKRDYNATRTPNVALDEWTPNINLMPNCMRNSGQVDPQYNTNATLMQLSKHLEEVFIPGGTQEKILSITTKTIANI
jgi:hypothetical protein